MPYDELFSLLSDPTRRRIIDHLRTGESAVGEIVDEVGIAQSGVSRHLRILADAGFVQARADGQRRLYSLRPEPFQQVEHWLDGYRALWERRLDRLGTALQERRHTDRQEDTA